MKISVVIAAYNEEKYLASTLGSVRIAISDIAESEIIVVDNECTDETRMIAEGYRTRIITENVHIISKVRNTGAANSTGDVLVFIDADTIVQQPLFEDIVQVLADEKCVGGAVGVEYGPAERKWIKYYLLGWQFWGKVLKMRQGAAQFCRRSAFEEIGGYDESIFMGEDVEFHWRLSKHAGRIGGYTHFIESPRVLTSARRYDKMGLWRTLLLTHPITIFLAWRIKSLWKDWYENAVR